MLNVTVNVALDHFFFFFFFRKCSHQHRMPGQNDKINNTTIKKNGDLFFFFREDFPQLPHVLEDSKKITTSQRLQYSYFGLFGESLARSHTHPLTMRLYETDPSAIALRSWSAKQREYLWQVHSCLSDPRKFGRRSIAYSILVINH